MAQQIRASFSLQYGADAQRFTPSGPSAQFSAGVAINGGFSFSTAGGASVFSRVLLPIHADHDTGSGTGNEGFKFASFPELKDSAGNPIADVNGLPLDFTTLTLLAIHVRAIDPDQPWGGTVKVSTSGGVVPGDTFGQEGIGSESLLICQRSGGWEPGSGGQIVIEFVPDGAPTPALVNALAEILIIGNPATPEAPVFTVAPTITGTATEGSTLSAHSGTFTGTPVPVSGFQWVRCNVGGVVIADIAGAVGDTYVLSAGDVGLTVRVRQTAANSEGGASWPSSQTAVISA